LLTIQPDYKLVGPI